MHKSLKEDMALSIPKEAIDRATECPSEFSCLSCGQCGDSDICKVESAHSEDILFLEPEQCHFCPYRLSVGEDQICRCPVRYAIYKMYGL